MNRAGWLLAAVALFGSGAFAALWRLSPHLQARAQLRAATHAEPLQPSHRAIALLPWLLALVLALGFVQVGVNAELVGGLHLHPLRHLEHATADATAACVDGRFVQAQRPIAGVCVGPYRLPVLFNAYTSTLVYWPLIALAELLPNHGGASLRLVGLLGLVVVLALVHRLTAAPRASPAVAALTPVVLVLAPSFAFYGSLYIYEYAGCLAVLAAWQLLLRFGQGRSAGNALLALLLLGLAVATKWTYVLVVVPFFCAYLWVYGLPRLARWQWLAGWIAALGPTCAVLAFAASLPPEAAQLRSLAGEGMRWQQVPGYIAHLFLGPPTALLPLPTVLAELLGAVGGLALLGWCVTKVRAAWRGQAVDPAVLVASATVAGCMALVLAVYVTNPTSMPILQYTPFLAIAAAAALVDATRALARPLAKWLVGVGYAVWLILAQGMPLGALPLLATLPPHVLLTEQEHAASLLARLLNGRSVAMPASDFDGVLEFVSGGELRPVYFLLDQRGAEPAWHDPGTSFVLFPIESETASGYNAPALRTRIRQLHARLRAEQPSAVQLDVRSTRGELLYALVQLRP